ncbi:uncharacterized protein LOC129569743 [Sitodiplosis mosellana]|uniref:uncharacterized protein LOC129569743 n=1 Tax=Sitodiplosis mosellana TaxID=263140 RepID=UPI002444E008|nr:uncharacterized protein LOC129569743 [Sitodiplosis mosellana]
MKKLQASTMLLIPKLPFQRLVREVLQQYRYDPLHAEYPRIRRYAIDFRMQSSTLVCLQEAAESYLVQLFEGCYLCCNHRSRVTLTEKDVNLVLLLRGSIYFIKSICIFMTLFDSGA